ncbi:MAG: hypothetical protein IKW66_03430, partial [Clostridia bacterium]|nr:hypothetical protein [Clostridia bacterium]
MATEYKASKERAYFAASNSRAGFHSYYEACFRHKVDRLFFIKGGPGTGKSTLMRRVARCGEARGYLAEYYYCSSDADSLDAILLYGEQGMALAYQIAEDICLNGSENHLYQVLDVLLDNALKYSSLGTV